MSSANRAVVVRFAEDAVRGTQRAQLQLFLRTGSDQFEEVVENAGHEVPGRAGIEAEPVAFQASGASANPGEAFQELDLVAFVGQERGGGKPSNATADHDCPGHPRGSNQVAATARAARPALKTSGTRTRDS